MILKWIVLGVALVVAPQWQMREVHAEDSLTNDEKALLELKEFLDENVEDKRSLDDDDDACGCEDDDSDCLIICYQALCSTACDDNDGCTEGCMECIIECSDDDDDDCPNNCLYTSDKRSLDVDLSGADVNNDMDKSYQNNLVKKGWFPRIRIPRIRIPRIRIPRIPIPRFPIPRIPIPRIRIPRIRIPRIRIPRIRFPRIGKK